MKTRIRESLGLMVAWHRRKTGMQNLWRDGSVGGRSLSRNVHSRFRLLNASPASSSCRIRDARLRNFARLRQNLETEAIAMQVVLEHELAQGRQVYDVHEKNLGYDITSLDLNSGELRLIEVKGLAEPSGTILLTPNERRVAEDRRDCYWLYVVTNCAAMPVLQEPIKDPTRFSWTEVTKVQHYWIEVRAMTQPTVTQENDQGHGGQL